MRQSLFLVLFFLLFANCFAQYKNDNVAFTTVYPEELCKTLDKNKGFLLLDVRSPSEHNDTSTFGTYNLGRMKGAKNINIQELDKRLNEISEYRNKPVFVYCSHSQRSRRASKMLSDSGFTKVFNINGGMTALHYLGTTETECLSKLYETGNGYTLISPEEMCEKISKANPAVIDVRSDSAWAHISRDQKENMLGYIKGAQHVSLESFGSYSLPEKEIIITDAWGDRAAKAAAMATKSGARKVFVLVEGVDRMLSLDEKDLPCKRDIYVSVSPVKLLGPTEFDRLASTNRDILFLDVRSAEEFANTHKDSYRNIGHLKGAINMPYSEFNSRLGEILKDRDKEIILYVFSGGTDVFAAANTLKDNGFTKVSVLMGGIFNLRWTAANRKGASDIKKWVVDVPEANW